MSGVESGYQLTEELKIQVSKELMTKLKRLLAIKSHSNPFWDMAKLVGQMTDLALTHWDPVEKAKRYQRREEKKKTSAPAQKHCVEGARKIEFVYNSENGSDEEPASTLGKTSDKRPDHGPEKEPDSTSSV